ncbi:MAG: hypothetical protein K6T65_03670 [Peptococcaceae bacterium]|nr:hypothetical protein [Peptococcaceae bacterium]
MFKLAQDLARSGERIENLVIGMADARQTLHDTFESLKKHEVIISGQVASERRNNQPAYPNEDMRKAEVVRRLEADPEYRELKERLQDARVNLAFAEAELEREKANHVGMVAMAGLLTALVNAGRIEDVERFVRDVLDAGGRSDKGPAQDSGKNNGHIPAGAGPACGQAAADGPEDSELQTGAFMVLEARESRPGTVRGYCQAADGNKVAVYAKNGHGQTLAGAVGGFVQVSYRRGDKGLIATSVKLVR